MKKRLTFRCWKCAREYSMIREIEGQPQLIVACPFCLEEGVVDLNPYRDAKRVVYRGDGAPPDAALPAYTFPAVIPTAAPAAAAADDVP
jgi:hypothetical protein